MNKFESFDSNLESKEEITPKGIIQQELEKLLDNKDKKSRRSFLKFCGAALGALALESLGASKIQAATDKISSLEKEEKFESGINYSSEKAHEQLEQYERFYEDLKDSETPVIITTTEDLMANLSDKERASFGLRSLNVMAFAFHAKQMTDKTIEKLGLQEDAMYIQFHDIKKERQEDGYRVAYHEGRHAKHQIDYHEENPDSRSNIIRYPEISEKLNSLIEEMITNMETIQFLDNQQKNPDSTILTKEEFSVLDEQIQKEKEYCIRNYLAYYRDRYGKDFDLPCGEWEVDDKIDSVVEKIWIDNNLNDALAKEYGE